MNGPAAHCPSYYAATRNDDHHYPALSGERRVDVCIVGAGFTGIATALTLAERGYTVAVLEQHLVGWGASGRNGGQMIAGMSGESRLQKQLGPGHDDTLHNLAYRGNKIIAERVDRYSIDCDLSYGYIDVALKPAHLDEQSRWFDALCARGMEADLELVPADVLPEIIGTRQYLGGLINRRNGHLHPLNLCLGEARACRELGVSIYERTPVLGIHHGRRAVVETAAGNVIADAVVVAGNAYHRLERRALSGLVFPAGSYIIATEPLSDREVDQLNPQNLAICDQNEVLDYFRLSADQRLLFGGRCNYSGREPRDIAAVMQPRLSKIYPQLAHKKIDYAWGGKIGIVANRVPLMGRTADNVYYAMGYSGHGVNMSHLFGEIIADAIAGSMERMDIFAGVPHLRWPFGQWTGNQAMAMGMLYYRLRDLL